MKRAKRVFSLNVVGGHRFRDHYVWAVSLAAYTVESGPSIELNSEAGEPFILQIDVFGT